MLPSKSSILHAIGVSLSISGICLSHVDPYLPFQSVATVQSGVPYSNWPSKHGLPMDNIIRGISFCGARGRRRDTHLENESGNDAYADLEDFIVGDDEEID